MTPSHALSPLSANERIELLDVLRGFALLGILLMNIEAMVGPMMAALGGLDSALRGADRWADAAIYLLVQGKFYVLFSLLFGMGFAVMLQRAQEHDRRFFLLYLRRLLALLVIGLGHALLIWSGDILTTYALVAGVLLLFFRNTPTSRLPSWSLALVLVPCALSLLFGFFGSVSQLDPIAASEWQAAMAEQESAMLAMIEAQRAAYGAGSYAQAVLQRLADLETMLGFLVFYGWQILGVFLLGVWFVRSGAVVQPQAHAALFSRLRVFALPIGSGLVLGSFLLLPEIPWGRMDLTVASASTLAILGSMLMSLGYLGLIVAGLQSPRWAPRLAWLAPAGRMALSNYLLQSIVCTGLFYGYGLGLFEQLPRFWQLPFVLALYALQVVGSHWWLARFRFGPVEWLWRAATYLQWPPMRRVTA